VSWRKISGPSATLSNATSASASASVSSSGTYVFKLTVTDNAGATDTDFVRVVVGSTSSGSTTTNAAPVARAGSDVTITLPNSTVYLYGNTSTDDGSIASYRWTKLSGPSTGNLSNTTSYKAQAWGLVAGTYVYRLTVKDNAGLTDTDDVQVIVKSSTTSSTSTNTAPVVKAGSDFTLKLPASTAYCQGTASDADGIASWNWVKLTGPSCELSNTTSSKLTAWRMVAGSYVFRLTVKDKKGASAYDDIKIVVYN
jgi:hypothetical protein